MTEQHLESLRLKGGHTGLSGYTLVKMPHYWKSHVAAHMSILLSMLNYLPLEVDTLIRYFIMIYTFTC